MSSCLGIYVDKNLIKYAKLKKVRDTFKVEAFNVEVFEDLETAIEKVISETNSYKVPISINISNELYNYFDVFSMLEKKDITKSLDIEFEMLCADKGYDKKALESRYILMDNPEDLEKYKAIYISANKNEVDEKLDILSKYRLFTMTPVSTSITNLLESSENENIAIVNLENETKITTVIDGQITRVDVLNAGIETAIEKVNKQELSWKKAYEVCKNITIYDHEVQSLDEHENEYIDIVMPVLNKIASEIKKVLNSYKEKVKKVYITGMGATISNIDLFFQDYLKNINCEVLKPFFIESTSLKVPTKEYIEVNSAIALALDGLGYVNKDLNYAPVSKFDNIEIETILNSKENFDIKNWRELFKEPLSIQEKLITRTISAGLIAIVMFCIFSGVIYNSNKKQIEKANEKLAETNIQIGKIESELTQIESYTNAYATLINSANSIADNAQTEKVISHNAVPNMLNKIMFIIPQQVQIVSIENTENNHIVIVAVSEKYEQLAYFSAAIKNDGMLENVQHTVGYKSDSLVQFTIEGDLK